jgi:hypothetical protein
MADNHYEQNGSIFVEEVFDPKEFKLISEYVQMLFNNYEAIESDQYRPWISSSVSGPSRELSKAMGFNGVVTISQVDLIDYMMTKIQPKIESVVNSKLLPKNHFIRCHTPDTIGKPLPYHVDHGGNDVNMTINLLSDPISSKWSIYVSTHDADVSDFTTTQNQGVIYDGKYPHWRNAYPGGTYIQLFLHYVREDNPASKWCRWNSNVWGEVSDIDPNTISTSDNPNNFAEKNWELYKYLKQHIQIDSIHPHVEADYHQQMKND